MRSISLQKKIILIICRAFILVAIVINLAVRVVECSTVPVAGSGLFSGPEILVQVRVPGNGFEPGDSTHFPKRGPGSRILTRGQATFQNRNE